MGQQFKTINVEIKGLSPLLMNRLNPDTLESKSKMKMEKYSTETDAANAAYVAVIDGREQLYVPYEALKSCLIRTAKQYRVKRTSLSSLLAGTMRIAPEKVPLVLPAELQGLPIKQQYSVDKRAVVIQSQRVLKGRARIDQWGLKFQILYNATWLPAGIEETLRTILEDAGIRMGLLDFRPQHLGDFGTFEVVGFQYEGQDAVAVAPPQVELVQQSDASEEVPGSPAEQPKRKGRPPKKPVE